MRLNCGPQRGCWIAGSLRKNLGAPLSCSALLPIENQIVGDETYRINRQVAFDVRNGTPVDRAVDFRFWPGLAGAARVVLRASAISLAHGLDRLDNELFQHVDVNVTQAPNRQARLSHLVFAQTGK